jgi:hypothetical protein
MAVRVRDMLAERASQTFVGRAEELALLGLALLDEGPVVTQVHGIPGVGKTSLLDAFARMARERGATVIRLDCRSVEPTEGGFLRALDAAIGGEATTPEASAQRLGSLGDRVILALDTYELMRLLDTWLRQVFVPSLDRHVRVITFGRDQPASGWLTAPGWQGSFRAVSLGPLDESDAIALLEASGMSRDEGRRINRAVRGHPLALRLAASAALDRPALRLEEVAVQSVVEELTRLYLADVGDPLTKQGLEAASVVRRTTLPLLQEMIPAAAPADLFERLLALPFADVASDGLRLHDSVQQAISTSLRASDPARYREYRCAAWRHLRTELRTGGSPDVWRYTADMLYLLENPLVREGFFPSGAQDYTVEPARETDGPAIRALLERHDGPDGVRLLENLWQRAPEVFRVVRRRDDRIVAFYTMLDSAAIEFGLLRDDPVIEQWLADLRRDPVKRGQRVVFFRRWLTEEGGEAPSPTQAACWLDSKRTVMSLRPQLRRCYMTLRDLNTYLPFLERLGFREVPDATARIDGELYRTAKLDWGPLSVDGWLAGLVAAELGIEDENRHVLDRDARELVLDGRRVALTKLEFGVMESLCAREGKVVTRASLLEDVWGYGFAGDSNVVDVVIGSLRRKLGDRATTIETVRGAGYRLRSTAP